MTADVLLPFLLLVVGEIVLGLVALRVLWWMLQGWRETLARNIQPPEPDGPGGRPVLVPLDGAGASPRERAPLRSAA